MSDKTKYRLCILGVVSTLVLYAVSCVLMITTQSPWLMVPMVVAIVAANVILTYALRFRRAS